MSTNKHEKLVQEDLNVGTGMTWVTAPGSGELRSTQIGLHSFARGQREWTAAWTPGAITASGYATTTITVTDAAAGDMVMASHDKMVTNDLMIHGHVSAANTVKVVIYNPTAASITVAAGTLSVLVFPMRATTPTPVTLYSVSGSVIVDGNNLSGYPGTLTFTVDLLDSENAVADTTTVGGGAVGTFTFSNVPGGTYTLRATVLTAGGYTFDSNTVSSSPTVVDEDPELFDALEFTIAGGG